jgi:hypothetical protein
MARTTSSGRATGHDDHHRVGRSRSHRGHQLEAGRVRQIQVGQEDVGLRRGQGGQRVFARGGHEKRVARGPQQARDELEHHGLVVDHEHHAGPVRIAGARSRRGERGRRRDGRAQRPQGRIGQWGEI